MNGNDPSNPYIAGAVLIDEGVFFGRREDLDRIARELRIKGTNVIVLSGQRRIGKSSFLWRLYHTLPADSYFPVYFDLQDQSKQPLGMVLSDLADKITEEIGLGRVVPSEFDNKGRYFRQTFLPRLYNALGENRRPVFLLDEFDAIDKVTKLDISNETAAKSLLPFLSRMVSEDRRSVFVLTVGRQAEDLSMDYASIFKTSTSLTLWVLDPDSAQALVRLAESNHTLNYTEESVKRILEITAGHPYMTQLVCQRIWEHVYEQDPKSLPIVSVTDVEIAANESLKVGDHAFSWLWNGLSPVEKIFASAFAGIAQEGESISKDHVIRVLAQNAPRLHVRELAIAPNDLVRRHVLSEMAIVQEYSFAIELFRRWVNQNRPLAEVKKELDQIDPLAESIFRVGQESLDRHQLQRAVRSFRESLEINPRHFEARLLLGESLLELGRLDDAIAELERAFELDPDETHSILNQALKKRAVVLNKKGRLDSALDDLDRALAIFPNDPEASQLQTSIAVQVSRKTDEGVRGEKKAVKAKKAIRDVNVQRDIILSDQFNYTTADLARVERQLDQIIALLRQNATVRVVRDMRESVIVVSDANQDVHFAPSDMSALGLLQRTDAPRRCEEIYLARFVLIETYARWDRYYLPLAGILTPSMRLNDRTDQGISSAGISLKDVRQALTDFHKTRLVILGEPGAGKTTTLHRLALDLARERLRDPVNGKLPFRADLFKFADERTPTDFLRDEWESTTGLTESFITAITQGQVCFLLDGANQMPMADRSQRIERWGHWANDELPSGNWAVFTCRSADYQTGLRLPEVIVQPLNRDRMRAYFDLRFGEHANEFWDNFEKRLQSGDDRFDRLAENPFMLSVLADRGAEGKAFTDNRALLMDDIANVLLERELREGRQPDTLTADPRGTLNAEMSALSRLAFAMQERGEGTGLATPIAQIEELGERDQVQLTLNEVFDLAIDATVLEATTLTRKGKAEPGYAFYHHLLQEYFAARELLRQFRAGKNLSKHWRVPWHTWQFMPKRLAPGERLEPPPTTGWEETVVMTAGLAGKDAPRFIIAVQKDNMPLAGRCLAEAGMERAELKTLADETRTALLIRQRSSSAHLRARIDAGLALGEMRHPELVPMKFEVEGRVAWAILPPMQLVQAGEFIRGSEQNDKDAYSDYTTDRRIELASFSIGRYLLTNDEYALFIQDGGYKTDRWWSEEGKRWKQGGPDAHASTMEEWLHLLGSMQKLGFAEYARRSGMRPQEFSFWQEVIELSHDEATERARKIFDRSFDRPGYWNDRELSSPGKPVVGVNWYEAQAYCNWLSTITERKFRLPKETEWEKSARGLDGRKFPWGEKFASALCNTAESHIYTTTPIGLYPGGVSPFGLFDASGNVWEWIADSYQQYPGGKASDDYGEKFRVVRGGSWRNYGRVAHCAHRDRHLPVDFREDIGFRVCSSE